MVTAFSAAEEKALKFLQTNMVLVRRSRQQAISSAKECPRQDGEVSRGGLRTGAAAASAHSERRDRHADARYREEHQDQYRHLRHADRQSAGQMSRRGRLGRRCDRQLGRYARAGLVAAVSAAGAARSADRLLAFAHSVLVVVRARRGRRSCARAKPFAYRAVLHRRLRHARRRLHLERHRRSRSRRRGRTHALAADPVRPGQRRPGGAVSRAAGADRLGGAAARSTASPSRSASPRSPSSPSTRS